MYRDIKNVFKDYGINDEAGRLLCKELYDEGYTYSAICYVASKYEEKLKRYAGERRMVGILINAVRKYAHTKDYFERKNNKRK